MKQKILSIILTFAVLLAYMPVVFSSEIVESGSCGENVTYTLDSEGTLTISGTGAMSDFEWNASPFYNSSNISSVIIENGVTSIGRNMFWGCSNLTIVTIPDSVTSIGDNAFMACSNIDSVYISDLVAYLNIDFKNEHSNPMRYAKKLYLNNKRITILDIPDGVTKIPNYAFHECDSITSVNIPNSVTSIGNYAFYECNGITSINIPDSVLSIGDDAFYYCKNLSDIVIGSNVNKIGDNAFYMCVKVSQLTIPNSVLNIGQGAFGGCYELKKIKLSDNIKTISDDMFRSCKSLTDIILPDEITSIGRYAFSGCLALKSILIPNNVKTITEDAFFYTGLEKIILGTNVTHINENAFSACSSLKTIIIPKTLSDVDTNAFNNSTLQTVEYEGTESEWNEVYIGSGNDSLRNASKIFNSSYYDIALYKYRIVNGGVYITGYDMNETTANIPNKIENLPVIGIDADAFKNYTNLISVTIPNSVTSIGASAFSGTGITSLTVPDSVTSIGAGAFANCNNLTSITLGGGVETINADMLVGCGELTSLTISDNVKAIEANSFADCAKLDELHISDLAKWCAIDFANGSANPLSIASKLYVDDTLTTSLVIPDSVTGIAKYAFYGFRGITGVTVPSTVTSIGTDAFADCTYLADVHIVDLSKWCAMDFANAEANPMRYSKKLYIRDTLTEDITIPSSVRVIGNYAFYGCDGIKSVTIPKNVKIIEDAAFKECANLKDVYYVADMEIGENNTSLEDAEFHLIAGGVDPTPSPTVQPTASPTTEPTASPTASPTAAPTASPTQEPLSGQTYKISGLKLTDFNGTELSKPPTNGSYIVEMSVKEEKARSGKDYFIAALYSKSGAFVGLTYAMMDVPTGSEVSFGLLIPSQSTEIGEIRVFAWSSLSSMESQSAMQSRKFN